MPDRRRLALGAAGLLAVAGLVSTARRAPRRDWVYAGESPGGDSMWVDRSHTPMEGSARVVAWAGPSGRSERTVLLKCDTREVPPEAPPVLVALADTAFAIVCGPVTATP